MRNTNQNICFTAICVLLAVMMASCKKLVTVDDPVDTITADKMFRTEPQAEGALAGIYYEMINGTGTNTTGNNMFLNSFASGLSTYAGGLSADEFNVSSVSVPAYALASNKLTLLNSSLSGSIWSSAYKAIYDANSVIEGIAGARNSLIRDSVKKQYTAEAKFLRAFSYFYLVNFFGDLPITLTVDFNQVINIRRSPVAAVYAQILRDLEDAERDLPDDYAAGKNARIRANKWVAKAMLAKVYLYMNNHAQAAAKASEIIAETSLFGLEPLNRVFLADSKEAIFQFQQTNQTSIVKNATAAGAFFIPINPFKDNASVWLTDQLISAFEPGDQRWEVWADSTMQTSSGLNMKVWYPAKYKTGRHNGVAKAPSPEFSMVLRLAEIYLIRAEARVNGADGGPANAIADLNAIRFRTGLPDYPLSLGVNEIKDAVAHERQIELFAEWGNRWFDLKRNSNASAVLSNMPSKQPWEGDYQLLYPIPVREIEANTNILQNTGYIR
ncbi:RagB/SusD family nutrient uptake outer membrane protein [Pseudoflavitalea sp. G-6-1-2]|uniref:RagB/SusD family nutrient uptake outer membrane protein n=1 Tax=Pseudoflavitalea sp. G-6-1-2 TaxID=2728841 RepID=UPI00146EE25D|nr:RagB/SusD family nutrient uptake outer membrane protein [Pseudoflavitalea sp. G-6-1-2]NML22778.1 RagB/SusD family nutrient uptake outer membrane protein [Pseudoflavitalea sp. G-6-1-2]